VGVNEFLSAFSTFVLRAFDFENIKKCGLWPIECEISFVFEPYIPAV
jgi:hypothetical protein